MERLFSGMRPEFPEFDFVLIQQHQQIEISK